MTVRGNAPLSFCRMLVPPNAPPTIPKYFTILMTEMRSAIICVGFWRPSPLPDTTILNYPNDREMGAPLSFVGFWRPPPQTPQYLTILMTERRGGGAIIFCRILAPPPSPDATTLNDLCDREMGGANIL